ncbi:MAG: tRNA (guanine-N(1)-)-methyltransferase [Candidatus Magasanikbacteria bacterium GW2011_GWD2_43_18]|uniref:tRNA (guanine-N(1)-)-methyltransferase n=1 Tax=Candidatus Magasanikbacteria bacterium GW2011_GWE2_42_7 TaxID=1619052 RepID=A0A0G1BEJ9_9BACT|nr:MAG: tRNA (guanine-N(1)-)-methyltransferase [Candidatus Magasanikbacteria bacterium GW2011_GWC2_42_27]KKS71589.1 MAG: tRNA (guanine-N(1)-)-methyltransferase [Candidatus Magasanikbacteria bacterium GW2011_GWE2_42_7]KKT04329.1 MAG: tRNA (guanine-N(1)-)-methyltransferase [Candidatus Magasanikbacteria bacterium GW2011_GWD2_43_18]KKT25326.1 MAG: tRNA (guanine-N(1)-)-methyltransferase [Candidatus Magasanikbacteria bacterium GW2011_GWA2_43_9]
MTNATMKFNVLTIFPDMIDSYAHASILGRGQKAGAIDIRSINIRDFAEDKHSTVDNPPYGGGAGMVMKPEPIYKALKSVDAIPFSKEDGLNKLKKIFTGKLAKKKRTVVLSPRGRQFDQRIAEEWAKLDELTLVCGRYEGIDQRVIDHMIDEEISVGPYVLAGGELGALAIVEAVSRLIPGVLGNPGSLAEETFGMQNVEYRMKNEQGKFEIRNLKLEIDAEYPQYTKPSDFKGWKVPGVLLSGDHKKIEEWRKSERRNGRE